MTDQVINVKPIEVNISPDGFHMWAHHYFKCMRDFISPHRFSPVPYFLVCRAIELQLKAYHLRTNKQTMVKKQFGHSLNRLYSSLDICDQILSPTEVAELEKASAI